ncbi:7-cyano-7-deazaguanine synthase [Teredinibacter purpureus]|jgi:Predicted PP-loop superfamily ATPase|uniref:7-cyano-7-deazaguanine synthase n=1 Tax=Teredinibacter purpureus TaxID=2731756 RepID=UPI0005F84F7C|nr:7-cyano-7-deazaguanine synthase [Teredinibacter purpureus]
MESIAVLSSGGMDSAILLFHLAQQHKVTPIYVAQGLAWEQPEQHALRQFVDALNHPNIRTLEILNFPVNRLYGDHWSVSGDGVPAADAPDEMVFLPARNVLLFTAAAIWCHQHGVNKIAVGSLEGNPFPDASDEFFQQLSCLLSTALSHKIEILAPFRHKKKNDLIKRYNSLPLGLTLTCNAPRHQQHCGECNKCFERQQAFLKVGIDDTTQYACATMV